MPIRFFCEHCRQMLKIGTTKMGSVVDCPKCNKSVVVPPQSTPQAEQLHQMLKQRRSEAGATSSLENRSVSEPTAPESAWNDLGDDVDTSDWGQLIEQLIAPFPDHKPESFATPLPPPVSMPDTEMILFALQKKHKFTVSLHRALSVVTFFVGIVVGIALAALFFPLPRSYRLSSDTRIGSNEVTGALFYLNENGDRLPDADAVIICLPKDRSPSPLFSCQGLRPEDTPNNDTIQLIHELGGMYERANAHGSFTLPYRAGEHYLVVFISAHQTGTNGMVKSNALAELRRYFRDYELLREHCLHACGHEWLEGKYSLQHTFESGE